MDIPPPTFKQVWWQIVLGIFAGCAIGVIALTLILSRQPPPPQNVNATVHQAVMMIRIAIGK
jgi:hypothetical protein